MSAAGWTLLTLLLILALTGCSGAVEAPTDDAGSPWSECTSAAFPGCYAVPYGATSPCGTNDVPTELLCCCLGGDQ